MQHRFLFLTRGYCEVLTGFRIDRHYHLKINLDLECPFIPHTSQNRDSLQPEFAGWPLWPNT